MLLPLGTFVSFVTGLATAQPVVVALTTVAIPGALGYWAAAPRQTTTEITVPDDHLAPPMRADQHAGLVAAGGLRPRGCAGARAVSDQGNPSSVIIENRHGVSVLVGGTSGSQSE